MENSTINRLSHLQTQNIPTTGITNQILSRQKWLSDTGSESSANANHSTSSNSTSSSGCGMEAGGSSICSSSQCSNIDLSSLPSTSSSSTNIVDEKLCGSLNPTHNILHESQTMDRHLKKSDFNMGKSDMIQSYRRSTNSSHSDTYLSPVHLMHEQPALKLINETENNSQSESESTYSHYQRSNSVKYQTAAVANARRKPSFKFDSNILNRVQIMSLDKAKSSEVTGEAFSKRNSLGRDEAASERLAKRQQVANKSLIINQVNLNGLARNESASVKQTLENKTKLIRMGEHKNHQISLDSGIFLPPEHEELNAPASTSCS